MAPLSKNRIRLTTSIFWLLLLYVIASLFWWYIILETQNTQLKDLSLQTIENKKTTLTVNQYNSSVLEIERVAKRNTQKHIGEGLTFLLFIVIGAVYLHRSVYRQFTEQLQQQNFMMAVTHEFKTPIAVATLNIETLQKYELEPEKKSKLLQMTLEEVSRLNTLTNNILITSQLEGPRSKLSKDDLNFSALLKDSIQNFRNRHGDNNIVEDVETEIDILGDAFLLQMMINNLLENAIKYSPKGKPIYCQLTKQNNKVRLAVIDEGPGIADIEKKKIFDKFYRVGNEETRKTQGTGLGLFLCFKIAKNHNADIFVTNNKPTGSNFAVNFHT